MRLKNALVILHIRISVEQQRNPSQWFLQKGFIQLVCESSWGFPTETVASNLFKIKKPPPGPREAALNFSLFLVFNYRFPNPAKAPAPPEASIPLGTYGLEYS